MTVWDKSLTQFTGLDGKPALTTVKFFVNGTTAPATVYKDELFQSPHPADCKTDSLGRIPIVHLKPNGVKLRADFHTGSYKVRSIDGIDPGSPASTADTTPFLLPSKAKTGSAIAIAADDFGNFLEVTTATGAVIPVGLPKATTITNGQLVGLKNNGNGTLVLRASGVDLLDSGKSVIVGPYASIMVRATGASFETFAGTAPQPKSFTAKTRQTKTPPGSSTAGDTYLAPDDASGGWAPTKIYEANGSNGWTAYSPAIGDRCTITDETVQAGTGTGIVALPLVLTWTGTKWVAEHALAKAYSDDSVAASLKPITDRLTALETSTDVVDQVVRIISGGSSGTASLAVQGGVQPTANTWTRSTLTTTTGAIVGASISGNLITVPKGKYVASCRRKATGQISVAVGLRNTSGSIFGYGMPIKLDTNQEGVCEAEVPFEVTAATDTFELVFILSGTVGALSTGVAAAISGVDEIYGEVTIEKLA